jgi:hypothetical protein
MKTLLGFSRDAIFIGMECRICKIDKSLDNFYKTTRHKSGYETKCKSCKNKYTIENNKKFGKEYFKNNTKKWNIKNKKKISDYNKTKYDYEYYQTEKRKLYNKEWRENNKHKLRKYYLEKYKNDFNFRLSIILRGRFKTAIKNYKIGQIENLIGCSIEQCKQHLESQLKPEMTWENHGEIWEIDHIKPCSSFDLTNTEQQKQCFHYTNLQPLFKTTEIAKSFGYTNEIGNRNKINKYL